MKLPKNYEPDQYEADIYALWEKSNAFTPVESSKIGNFSLVIPPPNANGNLHMGHALTLNIEDVAVRYRRMKGYRTLFLPGADHAGFETQVVYEKSLASQGKSRFDFTREQLYKNIWEFVDLNKDNYQSQLRKLGASVDWDRFTYTLDEKIINQAYTSFKKMWDEGLIYRGEKLVNFCTFHGTGFADIEVEYQEEQGHMWHIRYPLTDESGELVVATTRPETMLGDVAVAVHPEDDRYSSFIGKTVKLPLTNREIPVLADSMVDKEFGTGAVKITPAHDINDYEVAQRHDLPMISVINREGKMLHDVPEAYRGLDVQQARDAVVKDLEKAKLLVKTEDHKHSVGHCYKCGTIIQPLLSEQWFIAMKPLVEPAVKALEKNQIKFYPESKKRVLINYLNNLRDWNISRQIAWGIPIPAFQNVDEPDDWIFDERVDQEIMEVDGKTYRRDTDVFDTWFSSSSWPYATLNYPDGEDYKDFYPLSVMETGVDILFPWVSRMIMFGLYNTGKVPFKEVYLHGLVLDENGQKMSKSKGNVINPMEMLDKYGSDALRLGVISGQSAGANQPFVESKLIAGRNFCNKLWNVARFAEGKLTDYESPKLQPKAENVFDDWMLYKLQQSIDQLDGLMSQYRFSEAYELLYHLLWDDFADWYIEASKTGLSPHVLAYCLDTILKLVHPIAPFVTETIWQTLRPDDDELLINLDWPAKPNANQKNAEEFEQVKAIVSEIRYIKGTLKLHGSLILYFKDSSFIERHSKLIKSLANLTDVIKVKDGDGLHLTESKHACWLDVDEKTANQFTSELTDRIAEQEKTIQNLQARLDNKSYMDNAPKKIVEQTKEQLNQTKEQIKKLKAEHSRFSTT